MRNLFWRGSYQQPKCKKIDCVYHEDKFGGHGCNYLLVTGRSKLGQIPNGEKYDIETCQFYAKGRKKNCIRESPFTSMNTPQTIREAEKLLRDTRVADLYHRGCTDVDIACIFGVTSVAVARWRKLSGAGRGNTTRHQTNWTGVAKMIDEGYSDKAIASFYYLDEYLISLFKKESGKV